MDAARIALDRMLRSGPALAFVFGSSWLDQQAMLDGVSEALGEIPIAGLSTAGEIIADGPATHGCVVALLAAEGLTCGVGVGERADEQPREAGRQAAQAAGRSVKEPRAGLLLFGDGLLPRMAEVVRGAQEAVGTGSLILGALAGDDLRFAQTSQYAGGRAFSRAVTGVLFGRAITLGVGLEHGFAPISRPRRITRASGHVLFELDDLPAASVYEEYFGPAVAANLRGERFSRAGIAYPLGVRGERERQWLLRTVVSFGEGGSLACSGEIREGEWLQLMIGSRELALEAARRAALEAVRALDRVACVLVFDSALRKALLGPRHAALEIAQIREVVGPSTPLAGCYTYGEQATGGALGHGYAATQTGSILVIALGNR